MHVSQEAEPLFYLARLLNFALIDGRARRRHGGDHAETFCRTIG